MNRLRLVRPWGLFVVLSLLTTACIGTNSGPRSSPQLQGEAPRRGGTLILGVLGVTPTMTTLGMASTPNGGWVAAAEIHSSPLITSDVHSRKPIGRLAERVPSLENGDVTLLQDGRMRVLYSLRKDVTWHDGAPFTSQDLTFAYQFNSDPGIPVFQVDTITLIDSVEAPDDYTLVLYFKHPYYQPEVMGLLVLWPLPRHILGPVYERYLATNNVNEVLNHPYWTSDYVHLGPFRLVSFDAADTIEFRAYDGYFLGRPKLDGVRVRVFSDANALYANLLSRSVDVFLETTLPSNLGFDLMGRWGSSGEGTVYLKRSTQTALWPQMRPNVQVEPTTFDFRVRAGLYHAIDREELSEGLQGGHRELAAWEILAPGELLHEATKDALRRYAYDPDRAKALLAEAGWIAGPDGILRRSSDGRRFHTTLSGGADGLSARADFWRRIGLEVDESVIPTAQLRNAEYRALYPGWEASSTPGGDEILGRLEGPAASAENRWIGNRGGYDDPRAQRLVDAYRSRLTFDAQFQAMKAISEFVAAELPFLVLYSLATHVGASTRVRALDDNDGGDSAGRRYGSYSRNAHLWEIQ